MSTYYQKLKSPQWQRKSGIYKLKIGDGFYIGSAVVLTKRLAQHYNDLRAIRHCNIHLQRSFNKIGTIDFDIVEIVEDVTQLIAREQYYIDTLKPRYNIATKAGSQLGFRHSAETKLLISKMQIGRNMSLETRRKMSESRKGKCLTESHKNNLSKSKIGNKNPFYKAGVNHPQFGKPKSQETRNRISETSKKLGLHKGARNKASKTGVLYDVVTGNNYIFRSLKPMAEKLKIPYRGLNGAANRNEFYFGRFYVTYCKLPNDVETKNLHEIKDMNLTRRKQPYDLSTIEGRREYQRAFRAKAKQTR